MMRGRWLLFLVCLVTYPAQAGEWPTVKPLHAENPDFAGTPDGVELAIRGSDDQILYRMICHSGEWGDRREDDVYDYSGALQCRLVPSDQVSGWPNLLQTQEEENFGRSWHGRIRFLDFQLRDEWGDTSDWGRIRQFRLRGMHIIIGVDGEKLSVDVRPDVTAQSDRAIAPPTAKPRWFDCGIPEGDRH